MRQLIEIQLSAEGQKAASSDTFRVGVRNAKDNEPAEISIYGAIGDSYDACDAGSVGRFLRANKGKAVNVRLNSPGGLAYDGITIHNALLAHDGPVKCVVEGLAASAASVIAMAGNPCQMYENAQLMIHRASAIAIGNRDMMNEAIDWLDRIDDSIARTYKAKTGKALDKIKDLMKGKVDGTIFTAREAKDLGFCDEILSLKNGKPSAHFTAFSAYGWCPVCGAPGASRERRPDGNDKCQNGHEYPSATALKDEPEVNSALRAEGESRLHHVESSRMERIRSRRELFTPAE